MTNLSFVLSLLLKLVFMILKNKLFLLLIFSLMLNVSFAQDGCLIENFFLKEGAKWEYKDYYKKGKTVSTTTTTLDSVVFVEDSTLFFTNSITKYNGQEVSHGNSNGLYICTGYDVYMSFVSYESDTIVTNKFNGIAVKTDTLDKDTTVVTTIVMVGYKYLNYPANLRVGQTLKGAKYKFSPTVKGEVYDRVVEKKEILTTPAGTFDCFLISYKSEGVIYGVPFYRLTKEWYCPQVGIVQTEIYNKKGKLKTKKVLTEFSK